MRKFVTAAAAALTFTALGLASPALADDDYGYRGAGGYQERGYEGRGHDNRGYDYRGHDGRGYDGRGYDWNRHERGFDTWERGWGRDGWRRDWNGRELSFRKIIRRVEAQGYYDVRGLREARWGWGYRAFAHDRRGRPVMLRINPYSGRVMDVRYV